MVDLGNDDTSVNTPDIDYGSGYTAAQIAQMCSDKQKEIKELDFKIKMADAEYKIMQTEVSDGNVYSNIDGEVVSLLTEEEAKHDSPLFTAGERLKHKPRSLLVGGGLNVSQRNI